MKVLFNKSSERLDLTAKVSPDNMKLFIDVIPKEGHQFTRTELIALLDPPFAGVDLDYGVLDDIAVHASKGEKVLERRIKKGVAPEPGADGKLLVLVKKFNGQGEIKIDEKGRSALTERHLFDNLVIGQVVARIYPPKAGKAGFDVHGSPIVAKPGKPAKVLCDKSILIEKRPNEEFEVCVAQQEGFLVDDSGKLSVHEELVISGELDLRLGSVDCIGKVRVSGHVSPGITVRAKKGIEIGGDMQQSILECPQGDVVVRGFAFGGPLGKIVCGGAVKIRVAQELRVEALKEIMVEKEAMDCVLRTQTLVQMPDGNLVGGQAFVVCGLEAKNIGNDAGKKTLIHLCSDIETSTEFAALAGSVATHDHAIGLVEVHLGPYAKNPARVQLLNEPFRGRMQKLIEKREELLASKNRLSTKLKAMLDMAHRSETLRVNVKGTLYPGVCIFAGEERFETKEQIKGPKTIEYSPKEKSFTVREIEPIVCSVNFEEGVKDGKREDGKKS